MADIFDFYVYDDRSIRFAIAEPIMLEDKDVTQFRFRIPKVLNNIDMTDWEWWFIFVNAKKVKYTTQLTLTDDEDDPDNFSVATYTVGYGFSGYVGSVSFSIEALNVSGEDIVNEWHTRTYNTNVIDTLQGTRAVVPEPGGQAGTGLTEAMKQALLQIARKVAYIDENGQTYYDALSDALYPSVTLYQITMSISHCTSSNTATNVEQGTPYLTTLTADEDYDLADSDITVTMGGVDVTSTVVSTGGVITIPRVTGDIVITATTHAWVTFINEDPSTWYIPPAATRDGSTVTFAPNSLNWDTVVKFKNLPYQYSALKNKRVRTMCSVVISGYTEGQGVNITPATFDTSNSATRKAYVGDSTLHGTGWLTSSGDVFFDTGTDTLADVLTAGTTAANTEWVGASLYCNASSGCTAIVTNIKCQYLS